MMNFVRFLWGSWAAAVAGLALGSPGCTDVPNPRNCVTNRQPCEAGSVCNTEKQICEPASPETNCIEQPTACMLDERCDGEEARCLPRRFVLGQPDDSSNLNLSYGLDQPYAAKLLSDASDGGKTKLVVTEWGSNRALIWNELPTKNRPADVVLGQQDLQTTNLDRATWKGRLGNLFTPWSIASDGTRLLLAERNWHRISIWSPIPTQSGSSGPLAPTGSWGQPDYLNPRPNGGMAAAHALGVRMPLIVAEPSPGRGFYVADQNNYRVLVFDGIPTDPATPPKWVIGQPDFMASALRSPQLGMGAPSGLYSDGTQLFVADQDWHRILVYRLPITRNDPAPELVIGQPDLSSVAKNRGGPPTADTLSAPTDVVVTSQGGVRRLWVVDGGNHRVLRYTLPATTADLVLGQQSYTTNQANLGGEVSRIGYSTPISVSSDGTRLVVAELLNHRVHIWNTLPTQSAQPSDVILGQPDERSRVTYMPPSVHGLQFRAPEAVSSDGQRLFVADTGHHRVLIWNRLPKDGKTPPDVVLGQRDFASMLANQGGVSASSLSAPSEVRSDGTRLYVADTANNRVLIWKQIPTQHFAPADVVIGQPAMNANTGATSAQGLSGPQGIALQSGALWISDTKNNRLLRFDPPLVTNAAATRVLGQPDLNSKAANAGAEPSERTLLSPGHLDADEQRLLVADIRNFRVLVWAQPPTTDFEAASVAVGTRNYKGLQSAEGTLGLYYAYGVHLAGGRLFVSSSESNRILVWNAVPTSLGEPAAAVLGQADFASENPNDARLSPIARLSYPMGMAVAAGRLYIADRHNNRIIVTEPPP